MAKYDSPGVYVEEISLLPPLVAGVSTAIPAFVGYTAKGTALKPTRISSMLEYEALFGGPDKAIVTVTVAANGTTTIDIADTDRGDKKYLMYYQVAMFFRNGGGACYIVSVGVYVETAIVPGDITKGIDALKTEDEPTLLVAPEAPATLYNAMLQHCADLKDRFAILDVLLEKDPVKGSLSDNSSKDFREKVTLNLSYGAAYGPHLQTSLGINEADVTVKIGEATSSLSDLLNTDDKEKKPKDATALAKDRKLYNTIKDRIGQESLILPPSGSIAGLYARIDRERGVWKAPANTGLVGVIGPVLKITTAEQDGLNVDATSGKSINVIRSFPGKGTLVWGARTLDGGSAEWRYINVRRLFIYIEESVQKATQFAVFEPNTASTWLKTKAMIESFLYTLWQQGALAGSLPKQAYYVNVGLGITMNPTDILNGKMIVEIGIAAVRPAEFIILRFMHKLQEA